MVPVTQAEIDEATMIAKNATYKLAYELSLDQKYGGNIDCCITKLKLLWNYERAIACHKEYIKASGTFEITSCNKGQAIKLLVDGVPITSSYPVNSANPITEMMALAALVNSYQTIYVAYFDATLGSRGLIVITGPDCKDSVLSDQLGGQPQVIISGLSGGVCAVNCLTDDKAKKLISKIRSMCAN